jgi:hypothetical protein
MATLAMPWELPSTRVHWIRWVEFAVFHVGVAAAIGLTFVMPYWPRLAGAAPVVLALQAVFAAACVASVSRLWRRLMRPEIRLITSPDDLFSLVLLTAWLVAGILAAPQRSEAALVAFFGLTAFFLVYVPFSKISHYIYYPFIRYYVGRHFGHRGAFGARSDRRRRQAPRRHAQDRQDDVRRLEGRGPVRRPAREVVHRVLSGWPQRFGTCPTPCRGAGRGAAAP